MEDGSSAVVFFGGWSLGLALLGALLGHWIARRQTKRLLDEYRGYVVDLKEKINDLLSQAADDELTRYVGCESCSFLTLGREADRYCSRCGGPLVDEGPVPARIGATNA